MDLLHGVGLISDLSLELNFEGLVSGDLFLDEVDSLLDHVLALKHRLLGENGSDHFEDIGVIIKHLELSHDHLVLRSLRGHSLLVLDDLSVL